MTEFDEFEDYKYEELINKNISLSMHISFLKKRLSEMRKMLRLQLKNNRRKSI